MAVDRAGKQQRQQASAPSKGRTQGPQAKAAKQLEFEHKEHKVEAALSWVQGMGVAEERAGRQQGLRCIWEFMQKEHTVEAALSWVQGSLPAS